MRISKPFRLWPLIFAAVIAVQVCRAASYDGAVRENTSEVDPLNTDIDAKTVVETIEESRRATVETPIDVNESPSEGNRVN